MTKPVTAAAVLSEVQKGRLSLEDKVSRFFDGFADQYVGALDENGSVIPKEKVRNEITIRMLLNHTSGILSDIGGVGEAQERAMKPEDRENLTTVTNYINHILLSFQPGETAFYSATGAFDVAARIVELTSGMPFNEYIDQFIMRPLGISDITFVPSEEQWGRMSQMHYFDGQKVWYEDTGRTIFEGFPLTYFCGGAGLAGHGGGLFRICGDAAERGQPAQRRRAGAGIGKAHENAVYSDFRGSERCAVVGARSKGYRQ